MASPLKRNGVITWILGVVMVAGILGVLGVSFSNQRVLAAHQQAARAHPVISVHLESIARDVEHIRIQVAEIDRRQRDAPRGTGEPRDQPFRSPSNPGSS